MDRPFASSCWTFLFFLTSCCAWGQAQEPIRLLNPSFEDIPTAGKTPRGWSDCAYFPDESQPDTQPCQAFEVTKAAYNGNTYLGLVVRENETWEAVSQRLVRPLERDKCYAFSIYLCRSEIYKSQVRSKTNKGATADTPKNFVVPARLRIWGGNNYGGKDQLLVETAEIKNNNWMEYKVEFNPKQTYSFISFEAYYKTPLLFPYNGNILLDNASDIIPINCKDKKQTGQVVASNDKKQRIKPPPTTSSKADPSTGGTAVPETSKYEEPIKLTPPKVDIHFTSDDSEIKPESASELEKLYQFMSANPEVNIEIGGHTNNIPTDDFCDELSTRRAKAVADFLIGKGIPPTRIAYKGYGKRKPLYPNNTLENQRKNQRVEIKILGIAQR
jgi:outer membrane protein OmpA-like peptidoglycan-associated protein